MLQIKRVHMFGAVFTSIMGTLLHFVYEWSGESRWSSLISSVNESTWEHLKLLVVPYLIFAVYEYFVYGKNVQNFAAAKIYALFVGLGSIIVLFYVYSGIIGHHIPILSILVFYIAVSASYIYAYRWISSVRFTGHDFAVSSKLLLVFLLLCVLVFTDMPPKLGLFMDPVTGQYGR